MANKSSKSPSGEERDQDNEYMRDQEPEAKDVKDSPEVCFPKMAPKKQENTANRGYEEDQPHNPVRSVDSSITDQEKLPAGEPDKNGN